jgi:DNA modification methylase
MNDRKFYGCEMNSDYFEIALNRLNEVKKWLK